MPRSVACPPSQRNATTARASRTWWPSVPTRRWHRALRTNMRLPQPSAQRAGPTSAPQRRRSAQARPRWRAPPPPRRSPTYAPGPGGGGNPEISLQEVNLTRLNPRISPQSRIAEPPPPPPPHLPHTCEKKMGGLYFFHFCFYLSNRRSYGNDHRGTDVYECV